MGAPGQLATCFADSPGLLGNLAEIPIAVTGTWVKDGHRFSITKEDLDDIVANFEGRANGQVVIDYEHASERPDVAKGDAVPASGWIHGLSVKHDAGNGKDTLWASVEWTPKAQGMIEGGEYKFFSPAIDWGAADKKTGRSKGATLTSGALTNHPFLEELPAIQLSDKGDAPAGKTLVLPVVDNAKVKIKIDTKHDGEDKRSVKMGDISFDQIRSAIADQVREKYSSNLKYGDLCCPGGPWVRDVFDDYAILDSDGKMFKIGYKADGKGNVKLDGDPEQVTLEYVTASDKKLAEAVTKSEGDGDHPSSHYLVVEDPKHPTGWHLRVKDVSGKVDHGLMGAAWASLHEGYRGQKYGGPDKAQALTKLKALYKSEGMKTPAEQEAEKKKASEVTAVAMKDTQFRDAVLSQVGLLEKAQKSGALCTEVRALVASDGSVASMKTLAASAIKVLDDIDDYGVEGDRGEQGELRKEAEKRAGAVDKPSDGDETEELSTKPAGGDGEDDDDDDDTPAVPKFSIRKMRAADKIGKMKHHAVVDASGKMQGYITHGDMMAHMKKMGAEAGRSEGTLKASDLIEAELKNATGRPFTMSDVTRLVERGVTAADTEARSKAHKLMLSAAITETGEFNTRAARRLLAEDKVAKIDYADFEDAFEDANKAVTEGQILPRQRASMIRLFLSDRESAVAFLKDQPKSDRLSQVGIGGTGTEAFSDNPDRELDAKISQFMKDNKDVPYKTAYQKVLASDTDLKKRYDKAHSRVMM